MHKIFASFLTIAITLASLSIPTIVSARAWSDFNEGPLNIFPPEQMKCGKGWKFPVLIWGDRDVNVCILKTRQGRFGGPVF